MIVFGAHRICLPHALLHSIQIIASNRAKCKRLCTRMCVMTDEERDRRLRDLCDIAR